MDRLKKIVVILISIVPPVMFSVIFDKRFIITIVLSILFSILISKKINIVTMILTITLLFGIYISLIIIPYSFYSVWLKQVLETLPKGKISTLVISVSILTYIVSSLDILRENSSIFKSITIAVLFSSFVTGKFILLLLIPVIISFYISVNLFKYNKINGIKIFLLLLTISALSMIISNKIDVNGSYTVNNLSYKVRDILISKFPDINLLTSIPGSDGLSKSRGKAPLLTSNKLFKIWGNPGNSYYLRIKIESETINDKIIDTTELLKPDINSLRIEVLSDFLPMVPTLSSGKFNSNLTPNKTISKYDILYLSRSNTTEIYDISDYYLRTGVVDSKIIELSKELKGKNDRETINNIRDYLWNNFQYSTETENKVDYIKNFLLHDKKGFCIHFTKSFILLARLNNISSREVSGYYKYIKRPTESNYQGYDFITGKDSHMWPEVYINNSWETFEVTPGYIIKTSEPHRISNISEKTTVTVENKVKSNSKIYIWVMLLVILLLLFLLLRFKFTSPIKLLINKGIKKGVKHPSEIGWIKWNSEAFGSTEYLEIFLNYSYKTRTLSKEDRATICGLKKLL